MIRNKVGIYHAAWTGNAVVDKSAERLGRDTPIYLWPCALSAVRLPLAELDRKSASLLFSAEVAKDT